MSSTVITINTSTNATKDPINSPDQNSLINQPVSLNALPLEILKQIFEPLDFLCYTQLSLSNKEIRQLSTDIKPLHQHQAEYYKIALERLNSQYKKNSASLEYIDILEHLLQIDPKKSFSLLEKQIEWIKDKLDLKKQLTIASKKNELYQKKLKEFKSLTGGIQANSELENPQMTFMIECSKATLKEMISRVKFNLMGTSVGMIPVCEQLNKIANEILIRYCDVFPHEIRKLFAGLPEIDREGLKQAYSNIPLRMMIGFTLSGNLDFYLGHLRDLFLNYLLLTDNNEELLKKVLIAPADSESYERIKKTRDCVKNPYGFLDEIKNNWNVFSFAQIKEMASHFDPELIEDIANKCKSYNLNILLLEFYIFLKEKDLAWKFYKTVERGLPDPLFYKSDFCVRLARISGNRTEISEEMDKIASDVPKVLNSSSRLQYSIYENFLTFYLENQMGDKIKGFISRISESKKYFRIHCLIYCAEYWKKADNKVKSLEYLSLVDSAIEQYNCDTEKVIWGPETHIEFLVRIAAVYHFAKDIKKAKETLQKFETYFSQIPWCDWSKYAKTKFAAAKLWMLIDPSHIFSLYSPKEYDEENDIIGLLRLVSEHLPKTVS